MLRLAEALANTSLSGQARTYLLNQLRMSTQAGRSGIEALIRPMVPLGQFRNTFIIAMDDEGVAIIDQHVAHERILFEQISERLTSRPLESQRLLSPIVLDVSPGEHQTLLSHADALVRFGFELEDFGGASLRIGAAPALLDWQRCEEALRAVAADLDGLSPGAGVNEALRRMAATMACHAAVKANDPLTREKMQYLLDELRRTSHSSVERAVSTFRSPTFGRATGTMVVRRRSRTRTSQSVSSVPLTRTCARRRWRFTR